MNSKIVSIREKMKSYGIDGLIVTNQNNIRYLIDVEAEGNLLLTSKENIFITDSRYIESVNNVITIEDEIIVLDIINISESDLIGFFADCEKVGIEEDNISYSKYKNFVRIFRLKDAVETNGLIEKERIIKDKYEIEKIRKACEITDNCYKHLLNYIKVGMTEKEIAFEIEKFFMENGADGVAFPSIVASGENSSKPHSVPSDRRLTRGDSIVIDFGAKYKGYCSDMTRTIFVGEVSEEIKELYNFILNCQKRATNKMKNNADAHEITESLEKEFNARNYSLIHALGHGVGLEVHELPFLSIKREAILKENMVVANEPGIYIPGKIGIRIEDTILINVMTSEVLTKSDKNLTII